MAELRHHFGGRNESHWSLVSIAFWPTKLTLLENIRPGDGKRMGPCISYLLEGVRTCTRTLPGWPVMRARNAPPFQAILDSYRFSLSRNETYKKGHSFGSMPF